MNEPSIGLSPFSRYRAQSRLVRMTRGDRLRAARSPRRDRADENNQPLVMTPITAGQLLIETRRVAPMTRPLHNGAPGASVVAFSLATRKMDIDGRSGASLNSSPSAR